MQPSQKPTSGRCPTASRRFRGIVFKQAQMQRGCSSCGIRKRSSCGIRMCRSCGIICFGTLPFNVIGKYAHIFLSAQKRTCGSYRAYRNYGFLTDFREQTHPLSLGLAEQMAAEKKPCRMQHNGGERIITSMMASLVVRRKN